MPFAVTLCFDVATAASIETLWQALAAQGVDTDRRDLGYSAHITLAIYQDDAPVERLAKAVAELGSRRPGVPVVLSGFGLFAAPSNVLWLAPAPSLQLLTYQQEVAAALPDLVIDAHYRPGSWVPHVTLSGTLPDPPRALAALLPLWRPVSGVLERIELVRFRPVDVLSSRMLRP